MAVDRDQGVISAPLLNPDDDSSFALDILLSAWKEGDDRGVARENMAYAAIFTGMSSLVANMGEDAAARMARGLERRVQVGEFSKNGTRQ